MSEPLIDWSADMKPVPLHRSRVVVHGRRSWAYNVEADKVYRSELQLRWAAAGLTRSQPLSGRLSVAMAFAGNGRNQPDLSNLVKAVEDAGNNLLWVDDRQIVELHAAITWRKREPFRVALRVWEAA